MRIEFDREKVSPREAQLIDVMAHVSTTLYMALETGVIMAATHGQKDAIDDEKRRRALNAICGLMRGSLPDLNLRVME